MSGEDLHTFTEEDYIELYTTSFNQEEIVNEDNEYKILTSHKDVVKYIQENDKLPNNFVKKHKQKF